MAFNFTSAFGIGLAPGGASASVTPTAVAIDPAGNTYVAGFFSTPTQNHVASAVDFDPGPGVADRSSTQVVDPTSGNGTGGDDIFVAKYTAAGALAWVRTAGAVADDRAFGIAVDPNGNVYTTGTFSGQVNFDPNGTHNLSANQRGDVFVWKLDANGNYVYATQANGMTMGVGDNGYGIAVDGNGQAYVTGQFFGSAAFGGTTLTAGGVQDAFVAKLDAGGNFVWARDLHSVGANDNSIGKGLAVDGSGNVYTTGLFAGTVNFNPGGNFPLTSNGTEDAYVSKLDANGNFVWAKSFGGSDYDQGVALALDAARNVFVLGQYHGTVNFNTNAGQPATLLTSPGPWGLFVSKFDTNGTFLLARDLGTPNSGADLGRGGIAVDPSGNVLITGVFVGQANLLNSGISYNSQGGEDAFLIRMSNNGLFQGGQRIGGAGNDNGLAIAVNGNGVVATAGSYSAPAPPASTGPLAGPFVLPAAAASSTNLYLATLASTPSIPPVPGDYYGTRTSNLGFFVPETSTLYVVPPAGSALPPKIVPFANPGGTDVPVSGDFDGDGVADMAVFNPTIGRYLIIPSNGSLNEFIPVANPGGDDLPVVGDYYGVGSDQVGFFVPETSTLYVVPPPGSNLPPLIVPFANPGGTDVPVAVDIDGDHRTDLAVFNPTIGRYLIIPSGGGPNQFIPVANPAGDDIPVTGDFYGTGSSQLGFFVPETSTLYVVPPAGSALPPKIVPFANPGGTDVPISGDFDGDGKADLAVFNPTIGRYLIIPSGGGPNEFVPVVNFGGDDLPVLGPPFRRGGFQVAEATATDTSSSQVLSQVIPAAQDTSTIAPTTVSVRPAARKANGALGTS